MQAQQRPQQQQQLAQRPQQVLLLQEHGHLQRPPTPLLLTPQAVLLQQQPPRPPALALPQLLALPRKAPSSSSRDRQVPGKEAMARDGLGILQQQGGVPIAASQGLRQTRTNSSSRLVVRSQGMDSHLCLGSSSSRARDSTQACDGWWQLLSADAAGKGSSTRGSMVAVRCEEAPCQVCVEEGRDLGVTVGDVGVAAVHPTREC